MTGEPGQVFHYSDAGSCVIQLLNEGVLKRPFANVMRDELFVPLGMQNIGYDFEVEDVAFASGHDKHGHSVAPIIPHYPYPAAAGLWTTKEDLMRVVIELMEAVKGNSRVLYSSDGRRHAVCFVVEPRCLSRWETGAARAIIARLEIGFQSMLVVYPDIGKSLIIMTNADLGVHQIDGLIGDVYRAIFN